VWGNLAPVLSDMSRESWAANTQDGDILVWGNSDGDILVWGNLTDGDILVWGNNGDGDILVWGNREVIAD
jgi:hypothetical protein